MPLRGSWNVKWSPNFEVLARVIDSMNAMRISEIPGLAIQEDRIILHTIPKRFDQRDVLGRPLIAVAVVDIAIKAVVHRLLIHRWGNDIPARTPSTEMIEGRKHPGEIVRF